MSKLFLLIWNDYLLTIENERVGELIKSVLFHINVKCGLSFSGLSLSADSNDSDFLWTSDLIQVRLILRPSYENILSIFHDAFADLAISEVHLIYNGVKVSSAHWVFPDGIVTNSTIYNLLSKIHQRAPEKISKNIYLYLSDKSKSWTELETKNVNENGLTFSIKHFSSDVEENNLLKDDLNFISNIEDLTINSMNKNYPQSPTELQPFDNTLKSNCPTQINIILSKDLLGNSSLFSVGGFNMIIDSPNISSTNCYKYFKNLPKIDTFLLTSWNLCNTLGLHNMLQCYEMTSIGYFILPQTNQKPYTKPEENPENIFSLNLKNIINDIMTTVKNSESSLSQPIADMKKCYKLFYKLGSGTLQMFCLFPPKKDVFKPLKSLFDSWENNKENPLFEKLLCDNSLVCLLSWNSDDKQKPLRILVPSSCSEVMVIKSLATFAKTDSLLNLNVDIKNKENKSGKIDSLVKPKVAEVEKLGQTKKLTQSPQRTFTRTISESNRVNVKKTPVLPRSKTTERKKVDNSPKQIIKSKFKKTGPEEIRKIKVDKIPKDLSVENIKIPDVKSKEVSSENTMNEDTLTNIGSMEILGGVEEFTYVSDLDIIKSKIEMSDDNINGNLNDTTDHVEIRPTEVADAQDKQEFVNLEKTVEIHLTTEAVEVDFNSQNEIIGVETVVNDSTINDQENRDIKFDIDVEESKTDIIENKPPVRVDSFPEKDISTNEARSEEQVENLEENLDTKILTSDDKIETKENIESFENLDVTDKEINLDIDVENKSEIIENSEKDFTNFEDIFIETVEIDYDNVVSQGDDKESDNIEDHRSDDNTIKDRENLSKNMYRLAANEEFELVESSDICETGSEVNTAEGSNSDNEIKVSKNTETSASIGTSKDQDPNVIEIIDRMDNVGSESVDVICKSEEFENIETNIETDEHHIDSVEEFSNVDELINENKNQEDTDNALITAETELLEKEIENEKEMTENVDGNSLENADDTEELINEELHESENAIESKCEEDADNAQITTETELLEKEIENEKEVIDVEMTENADGNSLENADDTEEVMKEELHESENAIESTCEEDTDNALITAETELLEKEIENEKEVIDVEMTENVDGNSLENADDTEELIKEELHESENAIESKCQDDADTAEINEETDLLEKEIQDEKKLIGVEMTEDIGENSVVNTECKEELKNVENSDTEINQVDGIPVTSMLKEECLDIPVVSEGHFSNEKVEENESNEIYERDEIQILKETETTVDENIENETSAIVLVENIMSEDGPVGKDEDLDLSLKSVEKVYSSDIPVDECTSEQVDQTEVEYQEIEIINKINEENESSKISSLADVDEEKEIHVCQEIESNIEPDIRQSEEKSGDDFTETSVETNITDISKLIEDEGTNEIIDEIEILNQESVESSGKTDGEIDESIENKFTAGNLAENEVEIADTETDTKLIDKDELLNIPLSVETFEENEVQIQAIETSLEISNNEDKVVEDLEITIQTIEEQAESNIPVINEGQLTTERDEENEDQTEKIDINDTLEKENECLNISMTTETIDVNEFQIPEVGRNITLEEEKHSNVSEIDESNEGDEMIKVHEIKELTSDVTENLDTSQQTIEENGSSNVHVSNEDQSTADFLEQEKVQTEKIDMDVTNKEKNEVKLEDIETKNIINEENVIQDISEVVDDVETDEIRVMGEVEISIQPVNEIDSSGITLAVEDSLISEPVDENEIQIQEIVSDNTDKEGNESRNEEIETDNSICAVEEIKEIKTKDEEEVSSQILKEIDSSDRIILSESPKISEPIEENLVQNQENVSDQANVQENDVEFEEIETNKIANEDIKISDVFDEDEKEVHDGVDETNEITGTEEEVSAQILKENVSSDCTMTMEDTLTSEPKEENNIQIQEIKLDNTEKETDDVINEEIDIKNILKDENETIDVSVEGGVKTEHDVVETNEIDVMEKVEMSAPILKENDFSDITDTIEDSLLSEPIDENEIQIQQIEQNNRNKEENEVTFEEIENQKIFNEENKFPDSAHAEEFKVEDKFVETNEIQVIEDLQVLAQVANELDSSEVVMTIEDPLTLEPVDKNATPIQEVEADISNKEKNEVILEVENGNETHDASVVKDKKFEHEAVERSEIDSSNIAETIEEQLSSEPADENEISIQATEHDNTDKEKSEVTSEDIETENILEDENKVSDPSLAEEKNDEIKINDIKVMEELESNVQGVDEIDHTDIMVTNKESLTSDPVDEYEIQIQAAVPKEIETDSVVKDDDKIYIVEERRIEHGVDETGENVVEDKLEIVETKNVIEDPLISKPVDEDRIDEANKEDVEVKFDEKNTDDILKDENQISDVFTQEEKEVENKLIDIKEIQVIEESHVSAHVVNEMDSENIAVTLDEPLTSELETSNQEIESDKTKKEKSEVTFEEIESKNIVKDASVIKDKKMEDEVVETIEIEILDKEEMEDEIVTRNENQVIRESDISVQEMNETDSPHIPVTIEEPLTSESVGANEIPVEEINSDNKNIDETEVIVRETEKGNEIPDISVIENKKMEGEVVETTEVQIINEDVMSVQIVKEKDSSDVIVDENQIHIREIVPDGTDKDEKEDIFQEIDSENIIHDENEISEFSVVDEQKVDDKRVETNEIKVMEELKDTIQVVNEIDSIDTIVTNEDPSSSEPVDENRTSIFIQEVESDNINKDEGEVTHEKEENENILKNENEVPDASVIEKKTENEFVEINEIQDIVPDNIDKEENEDALENIENDNMDNEDNKTSDVCTEEDRKVDDEVEETKEIEVKDEVETLREKDSSDCTVTKEDPIISEPVDEKEIHIKENVSSITDNVLENKFPKSVENKVDTMIENAKNESSDNSLFIDHRNEEQIVEESLDENHEEIITNNAENEENKNKSVEVHIQNKIPKVGEENENKSQLISCEDEILEDREEKPEIEINVVTNDDIQNLDSMTTEEIISKNIEKSDNSEDFELIQNEFETANLESDTNSQETGTLDTFKSELDSQTPSNLEKVEEFPESTKETETEDKDIKDVKPECTEDIDKIVEKNSDQIDGRVHEVDSETVSKTGKTTTDKESRDDSPSDEDWVTLDKDFNENLNLVENDKNIKNGSQDIAIDDVEHTSNMQENKNSENGNIECSFSKVNETEDANINSSKTRTSELKESDWSEPFGLPMPVMPDISTRKPMGKAQDPSSPRLNSNLIARQREMSENTQGYYLDIAYVPVDNIGNVDPSRVTEKFFFKVRASCYILPGNEHDIKVLNSIIQGKSKWNNKDKQMKTHVILIRKTEVYDMWLLENSNKLVELNISFDVTTEKENGLFNVCNHLYCNK